MKTITVGKMRALQAATTDDGLFCILAIDHRDAMRAMFNPTTPESVPDQAMTDFKLMVLSTLADIPSAVLLDPIYSVAQSVADGSLRGSMGLISAIEDQGYLGDPFGRQTTMLNGWGVEKAKRLGANGVKVLLFYNPDATEAAERQEALVEGLLVSCRRYDMPLFLEPIVYSLDPDVAKNSETFAEQRADLIIRSAERFSQMQVDILKVEFPIDVNFNPDETAWAKACQALDAVCNVPWVLLSAGVSYDVFARQVEVACNAGCSGFMVGRSVWGEAIQMAADVRAGFLARTARERLAALVASATQHGRPLMEVYQTEAIDSHWYIRY